MPLTFVWYFALLITHVEVSQIPLTGAADVALDSWSEAEVHDGMDAIINGMYNEWDGCSTDR